MEQTLKQSEAIRSLVRRYGAPSREEWRGADYLLFWRIGVTSFSKTIDARGEVTA